MGLSRQMRIVILVCIFMYSIIMSYLNVLEEPSAFKETEKEFYATFPSVTLCKRSWVMDNFTSFSQVTQAINDYYETFEFFYYPEQSVKQNISLPFRFVQMNLRNETVLEDHLNATLEETVELSGIVQFQLGPTIIPCVTLNPPKSIGSPTQSAIWVCTMYF